MNAACRRQGTVITVYNALSTPDRTDPAVFCSLCFLCPQSCIDWVVEGVDGDDLVRRPKMSIPLTKLNMVTQLCHLLDTSISDHPRMQDPQVRGGGAGRLYPLYSQWYEHIYICRPAIRRTFEDQVFQKGEVISDAQGDVMS